MDERIYRQYLDIKETDCWKYVLTEVNRMLERDTSSLINAKSWEAVLRQQGRIEALKLVLNLMNMKLE